MFGGAPHLDTGKLDMDILVDDLRANPNLSAEPEGRSVVQNEPK